MALILQPVDDQPDVAVPLEAEAVQHRRRHPSGLDDEQWRSARDGVLPALVHERAIDAAPTRVAQDRTAHQRDAFLHVDGAAEADSPSVEERGPVVHDADALLLVEPLDLEPAPLRTLRF